MVSYELVLSSAILIIILLAGSLNLTAIVEFQEAIWLIVPLLPIFIFFFISILAETSRTPFDLQEAKQSNTKIWPFKSLLYAGNSNYFVDLDTFISR